MNPLRLRLLRAVFRFDGEFCVRDFARAMDIPDPIASIYLRQLNARGLIGVRRDRIKVFYNVQQDRSLPDSVRIQETLKTCLSGDLKDGWEEELLVILKAFSHFNRLAILTRLAEGPAMLEDLHAAVGGCVKSMYHHLRFLFTAGLLDGETVCRDATVFRLCAPTHPLARVLLELTLGSQKRFARYYNPPMGNPDAASAHILARLDHRGTWRQKVKPRTRPGHMPRRVQQALKEGT